MKRILVELRDGVITVSSSDDMSDIQVDILDHDNIDRDIDEDVLNEISHEEFLEIYRSVAIKKFPIGSKIACGDKIYPITKGVKGVVTGINVLDEKDTENEGYYEVVCSMDPTPEQIDAIDEEFYGDGEFNFDDLIFMPDTIEIVESGGHVEKVKSYRRRSNPLVR